MDKEVKEAAEKLSKRRNLLKKVGATATLAAVGWTVMAMPPFKPKQAVACGDCTGMCTSCSGGCDNSCTGCPGCAGTTNC